MKKGRKGKLFGTEQQTSFRKEFKNSFFVNVLEDLGGHYVYPLINKVGSSQGIRMNEYGSPFRFPLV